MKNQHVVVNKLHMDSLNSRLEKDMSHIRCRCGCRGILYVYIKNQRVRRPERSSNAEMFM